jgi:hypothetical protein
VEEASEGLVELENEKDRGRHREGAEGERRVGFRPDNTPKPQNNSSAHATTIISSGQEMELANCSDIKSLVCWNEAEIERMEERNSVC